MNNNIVVLLDALSCMYLFKGAESRSDHVVSMVIFLVYIQVKGIWKEAV